jgi:hypothetical protein
MCKVPHSGRIEQGMGFSIFMMIKGDRFERWKKARL